MRFIYCLIFFCCCSIVHAQQSDTTVMYVNSVFQPVKPKKATYLLKKYKSNGYWIADLTTQTKEPVHTQVSFADQHLTAEEGPYILFYENGKKRSEFMYHSGLKDGPRMEWYQSGASYCSGEMKQNRRSGSWVFFTEQGDTEAYATYAFDTIVSATFITKDGGRYTFQRFNSKMSAEDSANYTPVTPAEPLANFLSANLRYPAWARENGVEGRAKLVFIVYKDGTRSNCILFNSICHESLEQEAERVLRLMDKWVPAKIKGEAVSTVTTLPVRFRLD